MVQSCAVSVFLQLNHVYYGLKRKMFGYIDEQITQFVS